MIRRTTRRGDRREYFSAPPGGAPVGGLLASAGAMYHRLGEIGGDAAWPRHCRPQPTGDRARLEEFRDVMAFVEVEGFHGFVDEFMRGARAQGTPPTATVPASTGGRRS